MWIHGERLKALRAEAGLSLREVYANGGPNKDVLSNIERGRHRPTAKTFAKIAHALGMSAPELQMRLEAAAPKVSAVPEASVASLSPDELERRVYGAAVEGDTEPRPVLGVEEVYDLLRDARQERDELEAWLEAYVGATTEEQFARRTDRERVEELVRRARLYYLFLFDVSSKQTNPRGVPYKSVARVARDQGEAARMIIEKARADAERRRLDGSEAG